MRSVFDVLDEIRKRPGLYLAGDESHRILQLEMLEQLLQGYMLALRRHGIREPVQDFSREFGAYIRQTKGWSTSCGPVAAICKASQSEQEAWELFWTLIDEFRRSLDAR